MQSIAKLKTAQILGVQKSARGTTIAALLAAFLLPTVAHADVCSSLRAQLSGSGRVVKNTPAIQQLNKQLAAIRAMERKRGCGASNLGGFFNACGSLANQRGDVQRKIAAASGRSSGGFLGRSSDWEVRMRLASLGCSAEQPRKPRVVRWDGQARLPGGNSMLFCVRLSDGYYFPTPNSQFVAKTDDYKTTLDRCQFICDDKQMDVYTLDDIGLESEEMRSVSTGKSYRELSSALAYREATEFKACDGQRYWRRVDEARARTVTPADMSNAIIPLPTPRPDFDQTASLGLPTEATAFAPEPVPMDPTRKVRIVGEPFLQE